MRKRGSGPKPKEERRKRLKKREEPVREVHREGGSPGPILEQVEWKTRDPLPPGQHRNRYTGRAGWTPKPLQPTDRSLGETVLVSRNIKPSAPLPVSNFEVSKKVEEKEVEKVDMEKLEKYEKRLVLLVVRLDRAEERLTKGLGALEGLAPQIQNFATLLSRMEEILKHYERRPR